MIAFTAHIHPQAWQRVKRGRFGQAYVPKETRAFKHALGMLAKVEMQGRKPMEGPVGVVLTFFLTPPKRMVRKHPSVGSDIDNFCKATFDALNEIVFRDDSQIIALYATKSYDVPGGKGRVEIEVMEFNK